MSRRRLVGSLVLPLLVACTGPFTPDPPRPTPLTTTGGEILHREGFDAAGGWPTTASETTTVEISDGMLLMRASGAAHPVEARRTIESMGIADPEAGTPITGAQPLALDVAAVVREGADATRYGVECWVEEGIGYRLAVDEGRNASIARLTATAPPAVIARTGPVVGPRPGASNALRATCAIEGNRALLSLSVNGQQMLSDSDLPRWPSRVRAFTRVGLHAENVASDEIEVAFDGLIVSIPIEQGEGAEPA